MAMNEYAQVRTRSEELAGEARRARMAKEARQARMASEARQARIATGTRRAPLTSEACGSAPVCQPWTGLVTWLRLATVIPWRRPTPADRNRLGGQRQGNWPALGQSKVDWSTR